MSIAVPVPSTIREVRPIYVLQQLQTIYGMAWTHSWDDESGALGVLNQLLETTLPIVHLTRIWVPDRFRRRNYGHTLLQHICQDADKVPAILTLQVEPDVPDDCRWIRRMYTHAGFCSMPREHGTGSMVRWPRL